LTWCQAQHSTPTLVNEDSHPFYVLCSAYMNSVTKGIQTGRVRQAARDEIEKERGGTDKAAAGLERGCTRAEAELWTKASNDEEPRAKARSTRRSKNA
jgi:hypothetical protein